LRARRQQHTGDLVGVRDLALEFRLDAIGGHVVEQRGVVVRGRARPGERGIGGELGAQGLDVAGHDRSDGSSEPRRLAAQDPIDVLHEDWL
jgi:hypothetical protein